MIPTIESNQVQVAIVLPHDSLKPLMMMSRRRSGQTATELKITTYLQVFAPSVEHMIDPV